MSNKLVNFYNRIRGAYTINMYSATVDGETVYTVDKTWKYIKQSIVDKFLPVIVYNSDEHFDVYHFTNIVRELDASPQLVFDGGENIINLTYVSDNEAPEVEIVPVASGGESGGGDDEDTPARDSYIVFLSHDDILVYQDGENNPALLPSDIPTDNGLIFIVYVEPDEEVPMYHYLTLETVGLDLSTFAPNSLVFSNSTTTITFTYNETAGGFKEDISS